MLEINNLTKKFGAVEVLKGITFSLNKGEIVAVIGSSGSGKSTLLRCINFLEKADSGEIIVDGEIIYKTGDVIGNDAEMREKRLHFGLVFQAFNLFPQLSILKNITLALDVADKARCKKKQISKVELSINLEKNKQQGMKILEEVGLTAKIDAYPFQLSGGQQQRVAIARALALSPDILCFDEPTSALDPELTGEVLRVIKGLKSPDNTMIIVTHEMEFAKNVADKIIFMSEGIIEEIGTPKEIFENPQSEKTKNFLKQYFNKH